MAAQAEGNGLYLEWEQSDPKKGATDQVLL